MPNFTFEDEAAGIVAGVDEAGRGPLCGPVVAAAVIINRKKITLDLTASINDSKKLQSKIRHKLVAAIYDCATVGLGAASVSEIENLNILGATMLSMSRAVKALPVLPESVLIDGNRLPDLPCASRTVVNGDNLSVSIAAASIIAKVTRDSIMNKLELKYPGYGWAKNSGYGTREHKSALKKLGVTPHHRRLFAPVNKILSEI